MLNSELSDGGIDTLRLGIGIHTGTAILGKMGYGPASSETAIGDTVNIASRLEQLTKKYSCQLMFSAAVAEKASLNTSLLKSVETEIRGRKDLLQAFIVITLQRPWKHFSNRIHSLSLVLSI